MTESTPRGAALGLVGVTIVWGATFTLVQSALSDVSTLAFLAMRFSLAAVCLALIFLGRLPGGISREGVKGGLIAGLCLFAAYYLQTFGLLFTTPSKSAFLTSLCVVMVPLLAALVYRKAPSPREAAGIGVATAGMAMLTLPGGGVELNPGDLMTVGAALAFAIHILVIGHFAPRTGFEVLSVTQVACVAALALSSFRWAEPFRLRMSWKVAVAVLVTSLLATALAFTVQAWAQRHVSSTRTALIFALEPVVAYITSWLVTGEILAGRAAAGALLILGGVLAVELKPGRGGKHPSHQVGESEEG